jgi:hypothetical protein
MIPQRILRLAKLSHETDARASVVRSLLSGARDATLAGTRRGKVDSKAGTKPPKSGACRHRRIRQPSAREALSTDKRHEQTPRLHPEPSREAFPRKRFVKPCTSRFRGNVKSHGVLAVRPLGGRSLIYLCVRDPRRVTEVGLVHLDDEL